MIKNLTKLARLRIKNKKLFEKAFIHRSFANENPRLKLEHNERLEFLGDAVLELAVTEYLYRRFKDRSEGVLTNLRAALVRGSNLAKAAKEIELDKLLKLSRGEERSGGRQKRAILAGTFEALIGAIYLDQGYSAAKKFINDWIINYLDQIISQGGHIDPKTYLQEESQDRLAITPTYEVISENGPDHNKKFEVAVFLDGKEAGRGIGSSKQKAQQRAASDAIKKMELDKKK